MLLYSYSQTGFCGNTVYSLVVFCYNICLFSNPVPAIAILKVVGCEDCVRENKLPLWGPGSEAPCCWAIFAIFWKKIAVLQF